MELISQMIAALNPKNLHFDMVKFSYSENKFPIYSNSFWMLNALQIMANPYIILTVTVYNCVFSKNIIILSPYLKLVFFSSI